MTEPRVVVLGASVAGLAAALELVRLGVRVELVSAVPAAHWPERPCGGLAITDDAEACAQDALRVAADLAGAAPLHALCGALDAHFDRLVALAVPFARTPKGELRLRKLGAARSARAAHVGSLTSEHVLWALDRELQRHGVPRHEHHELLQLVLDSEEVVCGCVIQDLHSGDIHALAADAVIVACNSPQVSWSRGAGAHCSEGALAVCYAAGAVLVNPEMLSMWPASVGSSAGLLPFHGGLLAEGGYLWVPSDPTEARRARDVPNDERDKVADELDDDTGDHALALAVVQLLDAERGVYDRKKRTNRRRVYLDVSHLPDALLRERLGEDLQAYARASGRDPFDTAMSVAPAIHRSLAGLWVDFAVDGSDTLDPASARNHATSIAGLFAAGEAAYAYRGAGQLEELVLPASMFGGELAARSAAAHLAGRAEEADPEEVLEAAAEVERARDESLRARQSDDDDDVEAIHEELADVMREHCGFARQHKTLQALMDEVQELRARAERVPCDDDSSASPHGPLRVRALLHRIALADAIAHAARARQESRGVHQRSDYPDQNDAALTLVARDEQGHVELLADFESCNGDSVSCLVVNGATTRDAELGDA